MAYGSNMKLLSVDLSTNTIREQRYDISLLIKWIGGAGLATLFLFEYYKKERVKDPLSPGNPLIIMTGPMTGVSAFGSKTVVVSISPLTGVLGKSSFAGSFGLWLKKAGYDGLFITGSAENPSYLLIEDDYVDIRSASYLWGKGVHESIQQLKKIHGEGYRVIAIGPSGEKKVRIACIASDEQRFAGRTGLGAVMGSKYLKAIIVKGTKGVKVYNEERLRELNKQWLLKAIQSPRGLSLREYGTAGGIPTFRVVGNLPIKHWSMGDYPLAENISGQTYMSKFAYKPGRRVCGDFIQCSIACHGIIQVGDNIGKRPEYETLAMLGTNLLLSDPVKLFEISNLADNMGLDTISLGEVLAWFTEACQRGFIKDDYKHYCTVNWGDYDKYKDLIEKIARREGVGVFLGEGVKIASEILSNEDGRKIAMHVKGLEIPAHNPRLHKVSALSYATSNRGACHLQGMPHLLDRGIYLPEFGISKRPETIDEMVNGVIIHQDLCCFIDSATLCKFGVFGIVTFDHIAETWNAITGLKWDKNDVLKAGRRVWYLERVFNYLRGTTNRDDNLPDRFLKETVNEGGARGLKVDVFDELLMRFYDLRGLKTKVQLLKKLEDLDIKNEIGADVLEEIRLW
ncbi:MAG: aldehyde ferredoxin oxidoreductase family protein [Ignisphaera sp.]